MKQHIFDNTFKMIVENLINLCIVVILNMGLTIWPIQIPIFFNLRGKSDFPSAL